MYSGEDRVKQVNALRELAADITFGDWPGTAEDKVTFIVGEEQMPDWFDDHDFELLIEMVSD